MKANKKKNTKSSASKQKKNSSTEKAVFFSENLNTDMRKLNQILSDAYEYGVLQEKPSKEYLEWFQQAYEAPYPTCLEDLTPSLIKEIKSTVNRRKKEAKKEAKRKQQRADRGFSDCDAWNIFSWFLDIMPRMLQQFRDNLHGYPDLPSYPDASQRFQLESTDEPGMLEWKKTLDRMIYLLKEMNEDTCSFMNPYEDEVAKAQAEFEEKYGLLGEGLADLLETDKEKAEHKRKATRRWYTHTDDPDHPEWNELNEKWINSEYEKRDYRDKCREEFFELFSKHFWDLWD